MKMPWHTRRLDKMPEMDATIVIQASTAWCKQCSHAANPQAGACLGCGKTFARVTTPLQFNAPSVKRYRSDLEWEEYS